MKTIMLIIKSLCKLCSIRSMLCGMAMLFLFGMGQADALSNQPLTAQPATAASGDAQIGTYSAQTRTDDWGNPWPDKGTWNLPDDAAVNLHRVDNPPGARFRLPGMSRVDTTAIKVSMRTALPGGSFGGWHEELIDLGGPTTDTRFEAYIEESRKWTAGTIVEITFKPLEGDQIATNWADTKRFRMTAQPKPGVWRFPDDNSLQVWSGTPFEIGGNSSAVAGEAAATGAKEGVNKITVSTKKNSEAEVEEMRSIAPIDAGGAFTFDITQGKKWNPGDTVVVKFKVWRDGISSDWSPARTFYSGAIPVQWISPADNSWYGPSADNLFKVSGKTDPAANQIDVNWCSADRITCGRTNFQDVKVGPDGTFRDVVVPASKDWVIGTEYLVKMTVKRRGQISDYSPERRFRTKFLADWVSPAASSEYWPVRSGPFILGGKTEAGTESVEIRSRANYVAEWNVETHRVNLNSDNVFSIAVDSSTTWRLGNRQVQFRGIHNGIGRDWSAVRIFKVMLAPTMQRWISPDDNSQYVPVARYPLQVMAETDPGVNEIIIESKLQGQSDNATTRTRIKVVPMENGGVIYKFTVDESLKWQAGKHYELRFMVSRDSVPAVDWSARRNIYVPYPALSRLDWISPDDGSAYAASPANPLKISGNVDPGVNWISTHIKLQGSTDEGRQNFAVAVTLDSENAFRDMPVLKSDQWEQGKTYEVKFASWRDNDQSAGWSQTRTFHVPYTYPAKVEWISPADGSAYTPLPDHPLMISGSTDPGVNQVAVWWQEIDAKNRRAYPPPIDVILDSNNEFNNVPVTGSDSWIEGKTYDVQFKVLRPGPLASYWSSVRKIHVPVKIPGQPTWISPATDSWQRPSQEQPLVIRGNAIAGVEEIKVFWKNEKDHESGATGYLKIDAQEEDGSFSFKFAESEKWSHDSAYEVWFSVKRLGAESVISTPRRFLVDRLAPTLSELKQSMSDDGHYTLSGTAIDTDSGLGFNGDGNGAMVIRWRTDDATPWSEGTTTDVSAAGQFLFGLTAEQLNKSWTVQVEMTATDRVGNVLTQPLVPYITPPVVKLDVNRVKWTPATNAADSRSQPGLSEVDRPAPASNSEMFAGDTFSYSISVSGKKGKAENLNLTYTLPPELEMHGVPVLTTIAKNSAMLNSDWNGTEEHAQLLIAGASVGAADGFNISIPLRVRADAVTSAVSRIILHADGLADSSFSDVVILVPYQGALKLVKSVNKDSAKEGDTLEYTIRFSNTSASFIVMEEIHDPIDPRMRLVNLTCGEDLPPELICSISESETSAVWKFSGRLPAGGSGAVGYSTTITPLDNQESR